MRINKFLSSIGYCSRRAADRLIEEGLVYIDDRKAVMGDIIEARESIYVRGDRVGDMSLLEKKETILIAVNKPRGIVCTTTTNDHAPNIVELINFPTRIYPIGRLDKDSEGLLLMTNEGEIVNKILRSRYSHEKEYEVTLDRNMLETDIRHMRRGIYIPELRTKTKPCEVDRIGECKLRIVLTQGLNRQIRRMCKQLGYDVVRLKRVRVLNIRLGDLEVGSYRRLGDKEMQELLFELGI